jgi:hypothetical protein
VQSTNTPHSKARQRKAEPNQKPQTHTQGARQASTTCIIDCYRERQGTRLTAWAPKGKEPRPNTNKRKPHKTHPHEAGSRHTHTCQPRRPVNRQPRTTSDNLGRGTRKAAQSGPARQPSKVEQAGPAQRRVTATQGDAELPERPQDEGVSREARPPGLHRVVGQGPKQRQRRGPEAPKRLNRGAQRRGRKTSAGRPAPSTHPCATQPSREAARLPGRRTRRLGG